MSWAPVPLLAALDAVPIIGVFRGLGPEAALDLALHVVNGGVLAVEITMDSPDAAKAITALREALPTDVAVGAGTVVTHSELDAAVSAGASFVISPHLDEDIVRAANAAGVAVVPGVASPTELHRAVGAGATMVKLFPAGALGRDYLTALRGPYPDVPIMVSGGVGIDAIPEWLRAGASAIGLGAATFGDDPRVTAAHAVALARQT